MALPSINTPPADTPLAQPAPLVLAEVVIGGRRYRIEAEINDSSGFSYTAANYSAVTMQKMAGYARDLLTAHELRHNTRNQGPLQLIGANSRGLIRPDHTTISHNFFIQPLSPEIANRLGGNDPAALKAEDIWNRLSNTLLMPQYRTPQPPAQPQQQVPPQPQPQVPAPQQPVPPGPGANGALQVPAQPAVNNAPNPPLQGNHPPPQPNRPRERRVIQPAVLQLNNHDFTSLTWYEDIPLRTRLRILHLHHTGRLESRISTLVRDRFQDIHHAMPDYQKRYTCPSTLLWQEYCKLRLQSNRQPRTLHPDRVAAAEHFLQRLNERASEEVLRQLMEQIQVDDEFFQYLEEQVRAEGFLPAETDYPAWVRAHYRDEIPLFARVLERYLDNH